MKSIYFILLGAAVVSLTACGGSKNHYDATGVFESTEVIVSAQAAGEIMRFDIDEGSLLEAGQQVGYIDSLQLWLKKQQLQANIVSMTNRMQDIAKQIAATIQQIETQNREKARVESLLLSNAANTKQLDDINAAISVLQKQLSAQQSTLENNNKSLGGDIAGIRAQIGQIEDQLSKCVIRSPIGGTVLAKYAEAGELAAQGKPLFKIADVQNMILRAYITADQFTQIKIGQQVKIIPDYNNPDKTTYEGVVEWISDKAEFTPKTIQTKNERANLVYAVKIGVKNDGRIKIGMYGDVLL